MRNRQYVLRTETRGDEERGLLEKPKNPGFSWPLVVHSVMLDEREADAVSFETHFAKTEYCDAAWYAPGEVLDGDFHPALQQAVRDLLARQARKIYALLLDRPSTTCAATSQTVSRADGVAFRPHVGIQRQ